MGAENKLTSKSYSGFTGNFTYRLKMLQFMPKLVVCGDFNKINPYAKLGLVIGSGNIIKNNIEKLGTSTTEVESKFDGNIATGFTASAGASYAIGKNTSLFAELNFINLSYNPKKQVTTKYINAGVDLFSTLTISDKEVEYVDEFSIDGSVATDTNQPSKRTKEYFALSSFGLNFGLRYAF